MRGKRLCLCSLVLALLLGTNVWAAEPSQTPAEEDTGTAVDTMTKTMRLPAGQVTLIPRYEDTGDILYILGKGSIRIRVTGTGEAEGADVYTLTKTLTELPDNDLERIPMTVKQDGNTCELLYVIYTVTSWDEYELPEEYRAVCCYGWLEKYYVSYDSEWEATMTYIGYPIGGGLKSTLIDYVYDYEELRNRVLREGDAGAEEGGNGEEEAAHTEGYGDLSNIEEEETPLGGLKGSNMAAIAGAAAGCALVAVLAYLYFLTAPIYAAVYTGGYKRIGRVRMKHQKDHYEAVLTEYLMEKGETQNFMIRVSKYLQTRSQTEILDIRCPSGDVMSRKLEKEVLFMVPLEE